MVLYRQDDFLAVVESMTQIQTRRRLLIGYLRGETAFVFICAYVCVCVCVYKYDSDSICACLCVCVLI